MSAFLADLLVVLHFGIVGFCVIGELAILAGAVFKWKWIRTIAVRVIHLCLALYVAGESILGIPCPLTEWEYNLRVRAGQRYDRDMSFVARIIRKIIFYDFPSWVFTALYIGFGLLILLTFVLIRPRRKTKAAGPSGGT
jgi:hypothetical protein